MKLHSSLFHPILSGVGKHVMFLLERAIKTYLAHLKSILSIQHAEKRPKIGSLSLSFRPHASNGHLNLINVASECNV